MDPAMQLVILPPARRGRARWGGTSSSFVAAGAVVRARVLRSLPRWLFPLLVSCAFLAVTACAAAPPRPAASAVPAQPAAAAEARPDPGAPTGFVPLEEQARRHLALRWRVDAARVRVEFETPSAGRLLLEPAAAIRIHPSTVSGAWVVVFDARPGTRPELRLPFRAALLPASTPVQTVPQ